jgi:uncharacterized protein (TIGR02757 family)
LNYTRQKLADYLNPIVEHFNNPRFIENDPILVPHRFKSRQDVEISGLFAAIFAWGQRKTIINKTNDLLNRMDDQPYDFILNHSEEDLKNLIGFKHRTFNDTDLLVFVSFLKAQYKNSDTLEHLFSVPGKETIEEGLINFHQKFTAHPDFLNRTVKHVATPIKKATCKRLCMYLRWMVRRDDRGVDFGIWKSIQPSQLIMPIDVHVHRQAIILGLLREDKVDWKTAINLTNQLKKLDPNDPVKYDFALFSLGANKN